LQTHRCGLFFEVFALAGEAGWGGLEGDLFVILGLAEGGTSTVLAVRSVDSVFTWRLFVSFPFFVDH
jgi:hypothetical protein